MSAFNTQSEPSVTYVPTATGGEGVDELEEFYSEYFLDGNPPSLETTLLSRTAGTDRVVDEMFVSFKHTVEMPWILPGVPPTNKRVEIAMVSIISFKGGKVHHEHVYWDQASVLMQVGLLDPKLVPQAMKKKGVKKLPVLGKTSARRVFGSASGVQDVEANGLIYDFEDGQNGDGDVEHTKEAKQNGSAIEPKKELAKRPKEQTQPEPAQEEDAKEEKDEAKLETNDMEEKEEENRDDEGEDERKDEGNKVEEKKGTKKLGVEKKGGKMGAKPQNGEKQQADA